MGAFVALAGCGAAVATRPGGGATGTADATSPPSDEPVAGAAGGGPPGPGVVAPDTATSAPGTTPVAPPTPAGDGHVALAPNWTPRAQGALDQLADTAAGPRLIEAYRASGAPIEVDDAIGTPARYEYRTRTVDGGPVEVTPTRVAIRGEALADARTAATLLGHELVHFVNNTPGTPLHDAIAGASGLSEDARHIVDETIAYTVHRELVEQLRPQPSPGSFSYESHSTDIDGFTHEGAPNFVRRSLVETFDAVASDPVYAGAYGLQPGALDDQRGAITAALEAALPALAEYVPADHVTVG